RSGDDRTFAGRVQWITPEGRSIISDIDDTIKISNVQDRQALVANTFLREFRAVPGMAPLYRKWADAGAAFHYVSGSPWQLHELLADFCRSEGFPAGSFHMKLFRLKDSSALSFFGSQEGYKTEVIEKILADFPHRNFTLVGDSGEQDPEVYAAVARKHPGQIQQILIRNVGGRGSEPARFQKAFEKIPADSWRVFENSDDLPEGL
nr:App1 family protein [Pirellulaceae bacterium]